MIYLASPYSHNDPDVREWRFQQVCRAAAVLMYNGQFVFSPISHTHPIAVHGNLPLGFDYWEEYDRLMLKMCSELVVLMLDGWESSKGVQAEIRIMSELAKPVRYMTWNPID